MAREPYIGFSTTWKNFILSIGAGDQFYNYNMETVDMSGLWTSHKDDTQIKKWVSQIMLQEWSLERGGKDYHFGEERNLRSKPKIQYRI